MEADDCIIMPLRLIDVEATIASSDSGGLYFTRQPSWHVISHTWSANVREFSIITGNLAAASSSSAAYESLFQATHFSSDPAFLELIQFLLILQDQGVKWVWYDAVCINQMDPSEKDREIQQMGTYYQNSLGCYVVQHGFGKGFKLLLDDAFNEQSMSPRSSSMVNNLLPRWFSRVWTFQEWVLPPKVTFLIDLASEHSLRKIAVIALFRHRDAPGSSGCLCCDMSWKFVLPWFLLECINMKATQDFNRSSGCCSVLKTFLLRLWKCIKMEATQDLNLTSQYSTSCHHFIQVPGKDHWYYADDVGYAFLVKLKFHIKNADGSSEDSVLLGQAQASLTNLMVAKRSVLGSRIPSLESPGGSSVHKTSIHEVIVEISQRDCSNPEDRVLSVLKLLEAENTVRVRTGKTLKMQLLELGRSLLKSAQDELVLTMCIIDGFGSETPGMSWMPEFVVKKGSWQEEARYLLQWMSTSFTFTEFGFNQATSIRCKGVCAISGELEIEGDVCAGELIFRDHDPSIEEYRIERFDATDKSFYEQHQLRTMVLQVGGQVVFYLCARVTAQSTCIVQGVDPEESSAFSFIAFPAPNIHLLQRISVWLIGLGNVEKKGMCLLVCIGDQHQGFHKIGYLIGLCPSWFVLHSQPTQCKIGGLGQWDSNRISTGSV
ncbi:hypothetical protein L7F22_000133 [Adiantum nelumboides]|nr:hypothetical protein [Adiantum nelumboides]